MMTEPAPISTVQPMTPPALDRVVKTCLAKDPEERWQTAHDMMLELKWIATGGSQAGLAAPVAARRKGREALGWVLAGVLLLFVIAQALMYSRRAPAEPRTIRSFVLLPERTVVESISLSPDGRDLAFVASSSDGRILLWVRPMDAHAARPVAGTEGAMFPFWSPDSRFLGFFAEGKLKKVEAAGGPAEALCDAANPRGGTWNRDGVILFSPNAGGGLYRVSSAGGVPTPLTALDPSRRENSHRWPYFLPDGLHFLYYVRSGRLANAGIYVGSLDSKETRRLVGAPANAAYAPPGYLLFDRDGTLMAQAFDVRKLRITGEPFPAAEDVGYDGGTFRTDFAVSDNGVLAYRTSASFHTQLTWFDRKGKPLGSVGPPGGYFNLSVSLDERKLAVSRLASRTGTRDLWLYDLSRGTSSRFTFNPSTELAPCWSPDGGRIAFSSDRDGPFNLYQKLATGSANDELLLSTSAPKYVSHWSPDGRYIVYESIDPKTKIDLWVLPLFGDRKPILYLQTGSDESQGQLSTDGRWMAYTSNESGRSEVYVQAFPISGGKWQISTNGGVQPRWRGDGKEIFYLALDRKIMAVTVKADSTFETGAPTELFPTQVTQLFGVRNPYAVTADGQRFLINTRVEEANPSGIAVVVNWHAGLKK